MEEEIRIEDYLRIINRWKWPIAICGLVGGLSAMFISLMMTPTYEAETTLYLGYQPSEVQALSQSYPAAQEGGITYFINTYSQIIRSRRVFENVIKRFNLETTPENLKKSLTIERVKDSNMVKIKFQRQNAQECADILNYTVGTFVEQSKDFLRTNSRATREFIESQIRTFGEQLKTSEEELQKFKEREGVVVLSKETEESLDRIAQLVSLRDANELNLKEIEKRLEGIDRQLSQIRGEAAISLPETEEHETLLGDLEVKLADAMRKGNTRQIGKLQEKISLTKHQLNEEILSSARIKLVTLTPLEQSLIEKKIKFEIEKLALSARQAPLEKIISESDKEVSRFPEKQLALSRLQRKVNVNNRIYTMLQERLKEAQIKEASEQVNIKVVDKAIAPEHPIKPKKKLNTLIGGFLGLLLGGGMGLFRENLKAGYKDETEIEKELNLPVLGNIPVAEKDKEGIPELIIQRHPHSLTAEAYFSLVTRLSNKTPFRSILVTSSTPQEGKSFNVAGLGLSFTRMGKKVLIIDGDLRRPVQHKIFGIAHKPGFSELLKGKVDLKTVRRKASIDGLEIIPSGEIPSDVGAIFNPLNIGVFSRKLKNCPEADIVIIDSPPLFSVADPEIFASQVDGVILVYDFESTPRRALQRAKWAIESSKGKLIGIICNKINIKSGYYPYYRNYHYYEQEK